MLYSLVTAIIHEGKSALIAQAVRDRLIGNPPGFLEDAQLGVQS